MLFKGMYFSNKNCMLKCYGLGVVNYNGEYILVAPCRLIDIYVKEIKSSNYDLDIIDRQEKENSLTVSISTYSTLTLLALITGTVYYIKNKK